MKKQGKKLIALSQLKPEQWKQVEAVPVVGACSNFIQLREQWLCSAEVTPCLQQEAVAATAWKVLTGLVGTPQEQWEQLLMEGIAREVKLNHLKPLTLGKLKALVQQYMYVRNVK